AAEDSSALIALGFGPDVDPAVTAFDVSPGDQPNRFGIELALELEDAPTERPRRVIRKDRNTALEQDRPRVVLLVHEMDGTARDLHPGCEDRFVDTAPIHPLPAEQWQKRGMNVENTPLPLGENVELTEVAGQREQVDAVRVNDSLDLTTQLLRSARVTPGDDVSLNPRFASDLHATDIAPAGDHDG